MNSRSTNGEDWGERFKSALARRVTSPLQGATFGSWRRLLRGEDLSVDREYLPRAAFTGLTSLFTSLDAREERRRFGSIVEATDVKRPLFILGHYRNGTTHLQNLLAVDDRLAFPSYFEASFPNSFLIDRGLRAWLGPRLTMRRRPQDNVALDFHAPAEDELALCGTTFLSSHMCWHFPHREERFRRYLTFADASPAERETWKKALLQFARKLTVRHGKPLVFKSPCHTGRIPMILEIFPDARFVHIHRDPFTVFQSTRHMEAKVGPFFQFQRRDQARVDEFILWRYREMYEAYLADRALIPEGQICEVSYRDLVEKTIPTLNGIYDSIGLGEFEPARPAVERYLARVNGYRRNRYDEMDDDLRQRIVEEWGAAFDEWNYPTHGNGNGNGNGRGHGARGEVARATAASGVPSGAVPSRPHRPG